VTKFKAVLVIIDYQTFSALLNAMWTLKFQELFRFY